MEKQVIAKGKAENINVLFKGEFRGETAKISFDRYGRVFINGKQSLYADALRETLREDALMAGCGCVNYKCP